MELFHEKIKRIVRSARDLEEMEQMINATLDSIADTDKIAFVAGPITAKTNLIKKWNRYRLDILTRKIATKISSERLHVLSCAITPPHLEKYSVANFYDMYDRISDRGQRLYLTGDWKNSRGAMGEYQRAKKRGIPIFEVKEKFGILPIWFRKISFLQL